MRFENVKVKTKPPFAFTMINIRRYKLKCRRPESNYVSNRIANKISYDEMKRKS